MKRKEGQLHQLSLMERQIKKGVPLPLYPTLLIDLLKITY